jgi:hypothetical protein
MDIIFQGNGKSSYEISIYMAELVGVYLGLEAYVLKLFHAKNTKVGSVTVLLTSSLTGLESAV